MGNITQEQQQRLITKVRNDILFFVKEFIVEPYNVATGSEFFITGQQKEGLLELQNLVADKIAGKRQDILGISIMAGKGLGKDAWLVWAILWFMFCLPFPKVPCVSVSSDQLDKVLWSEISKWLNNSKVKPYFTLQNDKLFRKDVDDSVRGKEWFAFKKAANPKASADEQVETLQGLHADYMLQIADEGSGILTPVYEALENNQTGKCNIMLIVFNPMHSKGYAIDTQYSKKDRWVHLRWSAEDSDITNKANIKRLEEDCGRESNAFRMNVLGLPPIIDTETLIEWDWVLAALEREIIVTNEMPLKMAMDCGAGGDKSIIGKRRGGKIYPFLKNTTADSMELSNWAGAQIDLSEPDSFKVDTVGIGWAVEGILRDKKGSVVESADCRRRADSPEKFANKRAEMYWNLREQFEKGRISIPKDQDLMDQLASMKYEITKNGLIQIIDKKKIRKEIGKSPDEMDALAMLYFDKDNLESKKRYNFDFDYETSGTWQSA